jgi:hypothetical protein
MTEAWLSRRSLVKAGLFGAGMLGISGIGLGLQSTVYRSPQSTLRALSAREYSIIAAVADRVCPRESDMPSARALLVADHLDGAVFRMHPGAAAEFKQLLALLENAAVGMVFEQRARPFTACKPEVQDRVLRAWQLSRFSLRRTGFRALAGLCMAAYWAQPETWVALGYPGPPEFNLPPAEPLIYPTRPENNP